MRPSQSSRTTDARNLPLAWVTNWVTIGSNASGRAGILMDGSSSSTSTKRHGQSPVLVAWGHGVVGSNPAAPTQVRGHPGSSGWPLSILYSSEVQQRSLVESLTELSQGFPGGLG